MSLPSSHEFPGGGDFRSHPGFDYRVVGAHEGDYLDPDAEIAWGQQAQQYSEQKLYELVALTALVPASLYEFWVLKVKIKEIADDYKLDESIRAQAQLAIEELNKLEAEYYNLHEIWSMKASLRELAADESADEALRAMATEEISRVEQFEASTYSEEIRIVNTRALDKIGALAEVKPTTYEEFASVYESYFGVGGDSSLQDQVRMAGDSARVLLAEEYPAFYERHKAELRSRALGASIEATAYVK